MRIYLVGLAMAALSIASFGGVAQAQPYSKAVQQFCRDDYKKYCGEYGLESTALRDCMNRVGEDLSKACVRALVRSGEVSQAEVDRRKRH
jgi:hypothetical protein